MASFLIEQYQCSFEFEAFLFTIMIGIYKITNPVGKVYIGQSVNIESRWEQYRKYMGNGQPRLHSSLKEYGAGSHTFEVIEECLQVHLDERERYWQDYYNVLEEGLNLKLTKTSARKGRQTSNICRPIRTVPTQTVIYSSTKIETNFVKVYKTISLLAPLVKRVTSWQLLFWMIGNIALQDGLLLINSKVYEQWSKSLPEKDIITSVSFYSCIKDLVDAGCLTKVGKGHYYLNPNIFWSADKLSRIEFIQDEKKDGGFVSVNPLTLQLPDVEEKI